MRNKHTGEVSLLVGEDEYTLRMTFRKVAALEVSGIDVFNPEALERVGTQLALFFELVSGQHGVESIDDADELLMSHYKECTKATMDAITLFFQRLTPAEETPKKEKKA